LSHAQWHTHIHTHARAINYGHVAEKSRQEPCRVEPVIFVFTLLAATATAFCKIYASCILFLLLADSRSTAVIWVSIVLCDAFYTRAHAHAHTHTQCNTNNRDGNFFSTMIDCKSGRQNLTSFQLKLLATIRADKTVVIANADKNLGPVGIDANKYIKMTLKEHLLHVTT
jgi:hypothetical protein